MKQDNIIAFEPQKRLLEKARAYVASPALFLKDEKAAVSVLIKALRGADNEMKQRIVLLLGSAPQADVAWPLYRIMTDPDEEEEIRHTASVQLNVVSSLLEDPGPLVKQLLEILPGPDPQLRSLAAFALGWEGNERAAMALIERLYDEDSQVQATAVNALANLRDDRVFNLLVERLAHGPLDQQRSILFNLWRFSRQKETAASVYLDFLSHEDDGLRLDALALLDFVSDIRAHMDAYCRCLEDRNPRIRALALEQLEKLGDDELSGIRDRIAGLRVDPDATVKAAATRIMGRIASAG